MKTTKIIVIDSGYDVGNMPGVSFVDTENGFSVSKDVTDVLGHGTMVANIIKDNTESIELSMVKIFDEDEEITNDKLTYVLNYVDEHYQPDIINLSLGISYCPEIQKLKEVCDRITSKGVLLIAAFDNMGAISYPAAFPNVIGVDYVNSCIRTSDYYYIENSPINVQGVGAILRLKGMHGTFQNVMGASFAAPYITAMVANYISEIGERISFEDTLKFLKKNAKEIYQVEDHVPVKTPFSMKKAIILPYNKEVDTLLRHGDLLSFEIVGVYDSKYLMNVGKEIIISETKSLTVKSLKKIDWEEEFDTVILGHTNELGQVLKKNPIPDLVKEAIARGKKVYEFDDSYQLHELFPDQVFVPEITRSNVPYMYNGKLRQICKPILCVVGTSSKQGKFSLQLEMKQRIQKRGFQVGHLSTEPTGYLLGADYVFPMGYNSMVKIQDINEYMATINYLMGQIEDKNVDMIVTGLQSQTIPSTYMHQRDFVIYNHAYFIAANPDVVILCVNTIDTDETIGKTICYLKSIVMCDVVGIVLFPVKREVNWNVMGNLSVHEDEDVLCSKRAELEQKFGIRTFILDQESDMEELTGICVNYFSEQG